MREFRLVYNSPCRTDRLRKTGNVYGRIHVRVPPISARTGEAMLIPFSNSPTNRAGLARVSRVDECHGDANALRLVGHKILQLAKGPSVQAGTNSFPCFDAITDVRQVFHADFPHIQPLRFLNDGLGHFMVDVFDMPTLPTRDNPQFPPGGAATVGLKTTAMGKVSITFKAQLPATKDLATACGGEIVFSDIYTQNSTRRRRSRVRDIQHQLEEPLFLAADQLRFLGFARGQQIRLVFSADKRHKLTPGQGKQRNRTISQGIGTMVVMDRCTLKANGRNRFVFGNAPVGMERFVRAGNPVNGIAGHLAPQIRGAFPNLVVGQVMESNAVPAAMFHDKRHDRGTGLRECGRKFCQFRGLLRSGNQFQGHRAFHI